VAKNTIDLDRAFAKRLEGFRKYCQGVADSAEQWAKANRKWKDQTGDARRGLTGFVVDEGNKLGFGVAHKEEYGVFLERDGDGEYAVLLPAVKQYKVDFLADARRWFGG
jgi:hypothetical protein